MRIILLGAPGAGKGTQGEFISQEFQIPKISTGDMLRAKVAEGSPVGQKLKQIMAEGNLVPEEIVVDLLKERIQAPDCANGYILDGFPRTVHQAEILESAGISIDIVIDIEVTDEDIIHRMSGRRVHLPSGRVYHIHHQPPKIENVDDITQEPLIQREDDKPETVKKRLKVYHEQTEPLVKWYENRNNRFIKIQGNQSVEFIRQQLKEALS